MNQYYPVFENLCKKICNFDFFVWLTKYNLECLEADSKVTEKNYEIVYAIDTSVIFNRFLGFALSILNNQPISKRYIIESASILDFFRMREKTSDIVLRPSYSTEIKKILNKFDTAQIRLYFLRI